MSTTETNPSNWHRPLQPAVDSSSTVAFGTGLQMCDEDSQEGPFSHSTIGIFAQDASFVDATFQVFERFMCSLIAVCCIVATIFVYVVYRSKQPAILAILFGIVAGWDILRLILTLRRIKHLRKCHQWHPEILPNTNITLIETTKQLLLYSQDRGIQKNDDDNGSDNHVKLAENHEEYEMRAAINRKRGDDKNIMDAGKEHDRLIVIRGQYLDAKEVITSWKRFLWEQMIPPSAARWSTTGGAYTMPVPCCFRVSYRWLMMDSPSPPPLVGKKIWIPLQSIVNIQIRDRYETIQMNVSSWKKLKLLQGLMLWWMKPMKGQREVIVKYYKHDPVPSSCNMSSEVSPKENIIINNKNNNHSDDEKEHSYSALDENIVATLLQNRNSYNDDKNHRPETITTQCLYIQEPDKFVTFIQSLLGKNTDQDTSLSLV